jgi:tRNA (guanine37-N1)-methyltransferase
MKISLLTLFPDMFQGPFSHSIIKRASEKKAITIEFINIRDFGIGKHKMVDDTPYGGGAGMLMRVDVLDAAIQQAKCKKNCKERVILLDATGATFTQKKANTLAEYDHLILICAHYEGVDERIRDFIDEEISIGDYVLTGGEIPAMVIIDAVARLIPGVLGKEESSMFESFQTYENQKQQLLEYPQYTKPAVYKNKEVPQILLSGHHANIQKWREEKSEKKTQKIRPDLLK